MKKKSCMLVYASWSCMFWRNKYVETMNYDWMSLPSFSEYISVTSYDPGVGDPSDLLNNLVICLQVPGFVNACPDH